MTGFASSVTAPQRLWILGPRQDWLLFLATPALILPLVLLAQLRFRVEELSLFVASFGALGHHLPGMIRAYGDRDLFQRFRVRFVLAPVFLVALCVFCSARQLGGLILALYVWGVWHGLAQTYGFLRIYDSKVKSFARLTCRLDMAMCVAWFGAGVILSSTRMRGLLNMFYESGGPLVPLPWVQTLRMGAAVGLGAVTLAFLTNLVWQWRRGQTPSPLKLVLMVTSFGFWWYTNVTVSNLLLGILLFEVFHDVQYLSIVWAFNLSRAEKGAQLGGLTRFLFRRSGILVGFYVGLVFAYGGLNYVAKGVPSETLQRTLMGILAASALLHFYYDGFIWKVREKSTRQSLGLTGGKEGGGPTAVPAWLLHGSKWLFFIVPLAWLGVAQARGVAPGLERTRSLAATIGLAQDYSRLGVELLAVDDVLGASDSFRAALAMDAQHAEALVGLGDVALLAGNAAEAAEAYRGAIAIEDLADAHIGLGNLMGLEGRPEEAIAEYRRAYELNPDSNAARGNLSGALCSRGRAQEAITLNQEALRRSPDGPAAVAIHRDMAAAWNELGRTAEAVGVLEEALSRFPGDLALRLDLAETLLGGGQPEAAIEHFQALLEQEPSSAEGLFGLGNALAFLGRLDEALERYRQALAVDPDRAEVHHNLAIVGLRKGRSENAESHLREAVRLDPEYAEAHLNLAHALRQRGLEEEAQEHESIGRRLSSGR